MLNIIDQAFDTLHERVVEMPNKVLDIFNNFFGEERVDMQGFPSKARLRNFVMGLSVRELFTKADMRDKLPLIGLHESEELVDVDLDSLPEDTTTQVIDALLSSPFTEFCKDSKTGFILVHFPRTVVTNEHDRSTVVNRIYVKVPITSRGAENGLFTMNRSEYTVAELYSGYMHSHANSIPTHDFKKFTNCCLGSGPLNNTQTNLSMGFDEDRWNIFCLELSKYVEVESIAGTPYHYLEKISFNTSQMVDIDRVRNAPDLHIGYRSNREAVKEALRQFMSYYLEHNNLTFSFRNGVYSLGMPFIEYLIHISNSFIEWVNKQPSLEYLKESFKKVIGEYTIRNGELYQASNDVESHLERYREYVGKEICTFKGRSITINITDLERHEENNVNNARLLEPSLAATLLSRILRTINYRYGRNQEDPSTITGKVRYKV